MPKYRNFRIKMHVNIPTLTRVPLLSLKLYLEILLIPIVVSEGHISQRGHPKLYLAKPRKPLVLVVIGAK